MTEPTRLINEAGGDELETSLLKLAQSEGPSPEGRRKILAAIASAGATSLTSQSAEAAKATGKGMSSSVKWGLLSVAAVSIPAAIWLSSADKPGLAKGHQSALQVATPEVKATPAAPAFANGPAPMAVDDLPVLPAPSRAAGSAPSKQQGSLADEVAQLQKAKLALKAGAAGRALAELNTYAQRFPRPMLGAESTVLRIEALRASGDSARARTLAEGFLTKNPNSPYATRLRTLTDAR